MSRASRSLKTSPRTMEIPSNEISSKRVEAVQNIAKTIVTAKTAIKEKKPIYYNNFD